MSAQTTDTEVDLQAINGNAESAAMGIEFGPELMRFGTAIAERNPTDIADARQALREAAGGVVVVDAAGVAANFQRMVRIADSIGIPVDDMTSELGREIRSTLELERFPGAKHSLA